MGGADRRPAGRAGPWLWRGLSAISAAMLAAMGLLVCVDVAGRYLFNAPLAGAFEVTEFMLALLVFAALPIVTREDSHISVSVVESLLGARARRVQRLIVLAVGAFSLAIISWRLWLGGDQLAEGKQVTGYLELPRAPIAYVMSVLAALACLTALAMIRDHLRGREAPERSASPID